MVDFSVEPSRLAGFKLDCQDVKATFTSNANRLLPRVSLPTATEGLLAELVPAFQKLQRTLSDAHQNDAGALESFATDLGAAANQFHATDDRNAASIDGRVEYAGSTGFGVTRFSGLQLPVLLDVEDSTYVVRQVVTRSIDILKPYDEHLGQAIGIKPVADYLTPLVADWEQVQEIGKRIAVLGINDVVAAQGISGGTNWVQTSWSGEASTAFGITATSLAAAISERGEDLDAVGKIVENGGVLLERLVYNQSLGLLGAVTQSASFLNFNLPMGVWALLGDGVTQGSIRSQIFSSVELLKQNATTRHNAIKSAIERISGALNYEPGQGAPSYNAGEFELPTKVAIDQGVKRYGYGSGVWWQDDPASVDVRV
ncbi:hypothetical protein BKG76_01175 [Mycobacteroides franklinii]|uniref:Uncharacterized protein n=1 Tax=Mycobacteroides franklinii TaxID=948102 RepID=A0A1S1LEJ6_9MYCO|nr:hypothetical protein [Mycobacteroides franklinii]OHU30413.1 hypothetical protein BKG76_01175 [Mycobacteroides franklinii]